VLHVGKQTVVAHSRSERVQRVKIGRGSGGWAVSSVVVTPNSETRLAKRLAEGLATGASKGLGKGLAEGLPKG